MIFKTKKCLIYSKYKCIYFEIWIFV